MNDVGGNEKAPDNEIDFVYLSAEFLGELMKFMSLFLRTHLLEIPIFS